MFQKARLKLTAWYLLIIMLVSILFSLAIYRGSTLELQRIERAQRLRQESPQNYRRNRSPVSRIDPVILEETKQRVKLALIGINLIILGVSGGMGYFLAGRTLKPIKKMVDEQNRFITDASHELRTPLTALKTSTEVGLRDKDLILKDAKALLKNNLDDINNLQALSDNLLLLAQFEKGNGGISLLTVDISEVLKNAKKKVSYLAKAKNIGIFIPEENYPIKGDMGSLTELVTILLDNAIKYSPKNTKIKVTVEKLDDQVSILVKDQGIGIDSKDIPHIFERFYRADQARSKTSSIGYGLGLSIAKKIIELHNGSIAVQSVVGKGTTITAVFPSEKS